MNVTVIMEAEVYMFVRRAPGRAYAAYRLGLPAGSRREILDRSWGLYGRFMSLHECQLGNWVWVMASSGVGSGLLVDLLPTFLLDGCGVRCWSIVSYLMLLVFLHVLLHLQFRRRLPFRIHRPWLCLVMSSISSISAHMPRG